MAVVDAVFEAVDDRVATCVCVCVRLGVGSLLGVRVPLLVRVCEAVCDRLPVCTWLGERVRLPVGLDVGACVADSDAVCEALEDGLGLSDWLLLCERDFEDERDLDGVCDAVLVSV